MEERFKLKPDESLVANVIYACAMSAQHRDTMEVFHWALGRNLLNSRACSGAINSVLRTGSTTDLPVIFGTMRDVKISPSPLMIGQALKASAVYGDWDTAGTLLDMYRESGGRSFRQPDVGMFSRACAGTNQFISAPLPSLEVFASLAERMRAIDPSAGPPMEELLRTRQMRQTGNRFQR